MFLECKDHLEHSKLEKYSFLRIGPNVWNPLLSNFQTRLKFAFKKKLKHRLVQLS